MSDNITRLLLIEDNPGDARLVCEMLRTMDEFEIRVEGRLEDGLVALETGPSSIVLLDLGLPDSQGLDTLLTLLAAAPDATVIVLTGQVDEDIGRRAVREGAQDYLVKGQISASLLDRAIRYALERERNRGKIEHLNRVLHAIRQIGQLVIRQKNPAILLQRACEILVDERGATACFLVHTKNDQILSTAHSGVQSYIAPLLEMTERGELPPCIEHSLRQRESVVRLESNAGCADCPMRDDHEDRIDTAAIPLLSDGVAKGALFLVLPVGLLAQNEERKLFEELCADLAFALKTIENDAVILRVEEEHLHLSEQLQQSQKLEAVGQLASGIAHDFNNILTVTLYAADGLLDELPEDSPCYQLAQDILDATERAIGVTKQLLAFSGSSPNEREYVAPDEAVGKLLRLIERLLGEQVVIEVTFGSPPVIHIDPVRLEQVLINLCVNARDAMPSGGRLAIATREVRLDEAQGAKQAGLVPERYCEISVTDSGCGISPEVITKVFEPFFTTKPRGKGTGIGLSVVRSIVIDAGGTIELHSEVGVGTTFTVRLPAAQGLALERPVMALESSDSGDGGEQILVVEDDQPLREALCRLLREAGYETFEADNGLAALEVMKKNGEQIQLVLTDVVMPLMNSTELVSRLRQAGYAIPVVFLTGFPGEHTVRLSAQEALLLKPVKKATLLATIRRLLNG